MPDEIPSLAISMAVPNLINFIIDQHENDTYKTNNLTRCLLCFVIASQRKKIHKSASAFLKTRKTVIIFTHTIYKQMVTNKTPGAQCALKQQFFYNTNDLVSLHVYFLIALVLNRLGRKT